MENRNKGFTLIELLIAVAIIGIITAIGIPYYNDYTTTAKRGVAQNNLRSIYIQQQEYLRENSEYYITDETNCSDSASSINTNLFDGQQIINNDGYYYCILERDTDGYTASAVTDDDATTHTITDLNVKNF